MTACTARVGDGGDPASTGDSLNLTADCLHYDPTAGVTTDTIKLGTSLPLTGALAIPGTFHFGLEAYLATVNAEGGVNGRKIELTVLDDGYDPAKTATNVNELVNRDKVFGIVGILGTATALAVQQDLQDNCVPNLFIQTGAPVVADPAQTWSQIQFPTYSLEAQALAQRAINAGVKSVSIISQNDAFGKAYVDALVSPLKDAGVTVGTQVTYDPGAPSVETQITQLAADGADAVFIAALGTKCPQILNGIKSSRWNPLLLSVNFCTSRGLLGLLEDGAGDDMIGTTWYKSPTDPQFAQDGALAAYREALAKYSPAADPDEDFVLDGWLVGQLLVDVLKSAETLDRASVMRAAHEANLHVDTMLDGVRFAAAGTTEPIGQVQLRRYDSASKTFLFIDPKSGDDLPAGKTSLIIRGTNPSADVREPSASGAPRPSDGKP
ncbi:ABC transporter substrate-binding protein [Acrocarpospora macrocephala]|uniref:ABC transporter substrate-binding protein n=1 Tax=Acrocarpospora macrocephala TaxID=150177 RepID=UPI0014794EE8|nr:ABC transporter substrate-binding protein [Acrocarpospora macrocephala]